ncbi:hypothetical protein EDC04DRAFT_2607233 [Pisolithus marmoratus]|nr:hypothetical protein EDC04DRAFT_2607233 [Pisolithus marmoratus]
MSVHWVLGKDETTTFLECLFSDQRAFLGTSIESVLEHLEENSGSDKYSEEGIADFFNEILNNLLTDVFLCKRKWMGKGANKPLNGFSGAIRKPDLILCKDSTIEKCEVQQECLQILGNHIVLTLFDQGGSISTHPLDIHKHPRAFLHILLGITFGDGVVLGFDSTISPIEGGRKKIQIIKNGQEYFIMVSKLLFISRSLHGRGTTVWSSVITLDDFPGLAEGQQVIVKDSFVDPLQRYTEGKILKILEESEIEGVP